MSDTVCINCKHFALEERSDYGLQQIKEIRSLPEGSRIARTIEALGYCAYPMERIAGVPKSHLYGKTPQYATDSDPCVCFEEMKDE